MTLPIRIVVIGTGHWGTNIIKTLQTLEACSVVATATRDYVKICKRHKPDAVVVATPAATHAQIALDCLKLGAHVFIEKPLALHISDVEKILATAKQYQRQIFVGYLHLYNPAYQAFKKTVLRLGQLERLEIIGEGSDMTRLDAGAIWDWGPHATYLLFDLLKSQPQALSLHKRLETRTRQQYSFTGRSKTTHLYIRLGWGAPKKNLRLSATHQLGRVTLNLYANQAVLYYPKTGSRKIIAFDPIPPLRSELSQWLTNLRRSKTITNSRQHQRITAFLTKLQELTK